jgi:hypothetical protein
MGNPPNNPIEDEKDANLAQVERHNRSAEATRTRRILAEQKARANLIKTLQDLLSIVVGLVGVLTAMGFVVLSTYLSRYTDIFGYNITASQYITAGFGAFFIVGLLILVIYLILFTLNLIRIKSDTIRRITLIVLSSVFLLFGSIFYGQHLYENVPRNVGGGIPSYIIIVFKEKDTANLLSLSNGAQNKRTLRLQRLAELTDGLLVRDIYTSTIAIVRNDSILGVIDDNPGIPPFPNLIQTALPGDPILDPTVILPPTLEPPPDMTSSPQITPEISATPIVTLGSTPVAPQLTTDTPKITLEVTTTSVATLMDKGIIATVQVTPTPKALKG